MSDQEKKNPVNDLLQAAHAHCSVVRMFSAGITNGGNQSADS